jgi:hypothetical protein
MRNTLIGIVSSAAMGAALLATVTPVRADPGPYGIGGPGSGKVVANDTSNNGYWGPGNNGYWGPGPGASGAVSNGNAGPGPYGIGGPGTGKAVANNGHRRRGPSYGYGYGAPSTSYNASDGNSGPGPYGLGGPGTGKDVANYGWGWGPAPPYGTTYHP